MFVPPSDTPKVPLDLMDISRFNDAHIRQPSLIAACQTLSLVQVGTARRDDSMLAMARHEYGRSLRLLSLFLASSGTATVWDQEVVSAIVVLRFCEVRFDAIGSNAVRNSFNH